MPPGPHWATRGTEAARSNTLETARSAASADEGRAVVHDRDRERPHAPARSFNPYTTADELAWPAVVLSLEQRWGDRFDQMADALLEAKERLQTKVLLFTSSHRAEGRTTLVLTLARALARRPGRFLLVDGDLTGPMMARLLGLRPIVGLEDVVESGHAFADALIESPDDHLTILPLRVAVDRPREFLENPAWSFVMSRIRREFDLVLIDGGPLFTGLSSTAPHRSVDAAVLVHNQGTTGERATARARAVLEAAGIPLLGLAETFV